HLRIVTKHAAVSATLHDELVAFGRLPEARSHLSRLRARPHRLSFVRMSTEPSWKSPSLVTSTRLQLATCRSGSTLARSWRTASITWFTPDACASDSSPPCVLIGS